MGEAHGNASCRDESAARVGMERKSNVSLRVKGGTVGVKGYGGGYVPGRATLRKIMFPQLDKGA